MAKNKKKTKHFLNVIRETQGWNCVLIDSTEVEVDGDEVFTVFYQQISDNPDVTPCNRYDMFLNGEHKAGGVIR